jgi:hypothetical protein
VSRKRRSDKSGDVDDFGTFVDAEDFIFENDVPSKLSTIWSAFFNVGDGGESCDARKSMIPPELVDSFNVSAKLVQAWCQCYYHH